VGKLEGEELEPSADKALSNFVIIDFIGVDLLLYIVTSSPQRRFYSRNPQVIPAHLTKPFDIDLYDLTFPFAFCKFARGLNYGTRSFPTPVIWGLLLTLNPKGNRAGYTFP
jgi:hypothetical protein